MRLEIGRVNLSIHINGNTAHILQEHDPAYREFWGSAARSETGESACDRIDTGINLELETVPDTGKFTKIFDSGQSWSMYRDGETYWAVLQPPVHDKPLWAACFRRLLEEVTVYCSGALTREQNGKRVILNPVRYPLDQLLIMYILSGHRGAIIHSAGINIDGRGIIFPGPSGAGKSTLCKQFITAGIPGTELFSDDRMIVRAAGDKTFTAFGTPWPGEAGIARNRSMPLAGIYFLCHGSGGRNRLKSLSPGQGLERLLKVISIPWYDREVMEEALDFCEELLRSVPVYELHFTPDSEAVEFLTAAVTGKRIPKMP